MTAFEFISVALSFVLGLGVTQLLSSVVRVFLMRDELRIDWIPLVWAASVFVFQVQYWWAIYELMGMLEVWPLSLFIALLGMALLLFVAGALVLPGPALEGADSLDAVFQKHGKWGLVCLSGYAAAVLWINVSYWNAPLLTAGQLLNGVILLLPWAFIFSRARAVQGILAVVFMAVTLISAYANSPPAY